MCACMCVMCVSVCARLMSDTLSGASIVRLDTETSSIVIFNPGKPL